MADEIFNEWASGVSLANNEYFQELPTELAKPADFVVAPEVLPANPTPAIPVPEESDSEVVQLDNGGTLTVEKTSRGWKATLDCGDSGLPTENFYGNNKLQLIVSLAKAKLEASKFIRKLKKEKLLGVDEPVRTPVQVNKPIPQVSVLSADDIAEIKNKLGDNPADAFDSWILKRFGMNPEQLGTALKAAEEAKSLVEAQQVKADVEDVNKEFIRNNPDFAEDYSSDPENVRKLVSRMAKAYLNKRITISTPQPVVDTTIYELYQTGYWTAENLETAKEELIEVGELRKLPESHPAPKHEPKPATKNSPSVPETPRIAEPTGQPVGLVGFSAKTSTPAVVPEEKPLTDVDLQSIPLSDLKMIAAAQLKAMQQGRQ